MTVSPTSSGLAGTGGVSGVSNVDNETYSSSTSSVSEEDFSSEKVVEQQQTDKTKSPNWLASLAPSEWVENLLSKIGAPSSIPGAEAMKSGGKVIAFGGKVLMFVTLPLWITGGLVGGGAGALVGGLVGLVAKVREQLLRSTAEPAVDIKEYAFRGGKEGFEFLALLGTVGGFVFFEIGEKMVLESKKKVP